MCHPYAYPPKQDLHTMLRGKCEELDQLKRDKEEMKGCIESLQDQISSLQDKVYLLVDHRKQRFRWISGHWELVDNEQE